MGTIIGAKTCTWQQQRATKTTTTRLNLRTAQTTTTKSSLCVWNKNKTTIFPRRRKVHSLCPPLLLLIVMQGEDRTTLNTSQQERL